MYVGNLLLIFKNVLFLVCTDLLLNVSKRQKLASCYKSIILKIHSYLYNFVLVLLLQIFKNEYRDLVFQFRWTF